MSSPDRAQNPLQAVDETIYRRAMALVLRQYGESAERQEFDIDAATKGLAFTLLEAHQAVQDLGIYIEPEVLDERFELVSQIGLKDGARACINMAGLTPQRFGTDAQA